MQSRLPALGLPVLAAIAALLAGSFALAAQHTVQPGETLSGIASRYGVSIDSIVGVNGISDPNHIVAGDVLHVGEEAIVIREPVVHAATYVVQPGDTLGRVAVRFGVTANELAVWNQLDDPNHIVIGQVLTLPVDAPALAFVSTAEAEQALREAAVEFGVPVPLMLALAWHESGFQQHVVSSAGAVGVMQLLPTTAAWVASDIIGEQADWNLSVRDNARLGAAFLAHLLRLSGGDWEQAVAAYFQGWGAVSAFGWYDETYGYVASVMAHVSWFE